jgi:hypothetical protein
MGSLITAAARALWRCEASRWRSSGSSNERRRCCGGLHAGSTRKDAFNDNVEPAVPGCLVGLRVEVCALSALCAVCVEVCALSAIRVGLGGVLVGFLVWSAEEQQTGMVWRKKGAKRPFLKWRYGDHRRSDPRFR